MCGRYTRMYTWAELVAIMRFLPFVYSDADPVEPAFNFAPTQRSPVIVAGGEGAEARRMAWGLLPSWAKDTKLAYSTINARLESVAEKPAFRGAWRQRRALVPLSGYFEWPVIDGKKRPHYIRHASEPVLMAGGLWESRPDGQGGTLETFSIVTKDADPVIASVHDRMPLFLSPEVFRDWLHGSADDAMAIAHSAPEPALAFHEVDAAVGNVRNQGPQLIEPVAATSLF